jgi:hypothetical protein
LGEKGGLRNCLDLALEDHNVIPAFEMDDQIGARREI